MGRPTAFEHLFKTEFRFVVRMLRLFGVPEREVEDVAQEVFFALHRAMGRGKFDLDVPPRPWLRTTTYRIARDHREVLYHQGCPTTIEGGELEPTDDRMSSDADRGIVVGEQWATLLGLLEEMEYERRAVFVLHEIEELTQDHIAESLAIPPTTVQSRLRAARAEFDDAIRRKRTAERRTMRDGAQVLLPLTAGSLLPHARDLPAGSLRLGAEARVWSQLRGQIGAGLPSLWRPSSLIRSLPAAKLVPAAVAFATGAFTGAATMGAALTALHPPPPPSHTPVALIAPAESASPPLAMLAASAPPPLAALAASAPPPLAMLAASASPPLAMLTASAPPPRTTAPADPTTLATGAEHANIPAALPIATGRARPKPAATIVAAAVSPAPALPYDVDDEAEMRCLVAARGPLDAPVAAPSEALRLLAKCEQRYPETRFPEVRARLRMDVKRVMGTQIPAK